jgi:hypothetical protein
LRWPYCVIWKSQINLKCLKKKKTGFYS